MPFDVISKVPLTGYAPPSALGLNETTAQLYVSGSSQMWEPVGGITIPVPVNEGGTGATTAAGARTNLSAAQSGVNTDITSLQSIEATGDVGSEVGINIAGASGLAIQVNNGTVYSSWQTNGIISCAGVSTNGTVLCGNLQVSGNVQLNDLNSGTPGSGISVTMAGAGANSILFDLVGTSTLGQALLGFTTYATQTSVGAAGAASAPPSSPQAYIPVMVNGTLLVLAAYKQS